MKFYFGKIERSEICTDVSFTSSEVMCTLIMELTDAEVKSQTCLGSLRVSCKRALSIYRLMQNIEKICWHPICVMKIILTVTQCLKYSIFWHNLRFALLPPSVLQTLIQDDCFRARLHETRSTLKPVWNLKPLWNVVLFTWQFTWRFHCNNFPNNSKALLHTCIYLLINANSINAKQMLRYWLFFKQ